MHRSTWVAIFLGLAPLGFARLSFDDEKVVAASMATLFTSADWISPGWKDGDVVLVNPKWSEKGRTSFQEAVSRFGEFASGAKDHAILRELQKAAHSEKSWVPADPLDPTTMMVGARVIVGEMESWRKWPGTWDSGKFHVLGVKSKPTVRVPFSLQPPGYSPNGQYAVVMGHAPWSMHSADIFFCLRRSGENWVVIQVNPVFYA